MKAAGAGLTQPLGRHPGRKHARSLFGGATAKVELRCTQGTTLLDYLRNIKFKRGIELEYYG